MNSECGMRNSELSVDNTAHRLFFRGHDFPCDREIETAAVWLGHALLLSSDTDCVSLWDEEGLVRTTRIGVYPQDMALYGDVVYICGGADGRVHVLSLPDLQPQGSRSVPGMPERICIHRDRVCLLTLLTDDPLQTALLQLDRRLGNYQERARFPGIPGALAADETGLWVGVSEQVLHLSWAASSPDVRIEGFGLPRRFFLQPDALTVIDELEGKVVQLTHLLPDPAEPN